MTFHLQTLDPVNDRLFLVRQHDLHFEIMGTCRKIMDEVRDFFHSDNSLEILVEHRSAASMIFHLNHLPLGGQYCWLHAPSIRKLRVSTIVEERMNFSVRFTWDQLRFLVNLEELQVDMFYRETPFSHPSMDSIVLNGIIQGIAELVSPNVHLIWGPWKTLRRREIPASTTRDSYSALEIPAAVLRDIAVDYEHLRGRKLKDA